MRRFKRIISYLLVSVSFLAIGYGLLFFAARPIIQFVGGAVQLFLLEDTPVFAAETRNLLDGATIHEEEIIYASDIELPVYGEQFAQVKSDVGIDQPVFFGDNDEILLRGAGHSIISSFPGFYGTVLIGAHVFPEFHRLNVLELGDTFTITTHYGEFVYRVLEKKVIYRSDPFITETLRQDEQRLAFLYTCWPFDQFGFPLERLVVIGEQISGPAVFWNEEDRNNHAN